jgi:hypothetical protein
MQEKLKKMQKKQTLEVNLEEEAKEQETKE